MKPQRRDAAAAARAAKAMQLRILGYGYAQIAEQCGYASKGVAHHAVQRELARTVREPADDLRQLEAERLDALTRTFLPKALKGDSQACARVLDVARRRADLLGLVSQTTMESDGRGGGLVLTVRFVNNWRAPSESGLMSVTEVATDG